MKYLFLLLFSACATVPKPASDKDVTWVQGLQATAQETNYWCAAASAQMLMSQFGVFPKQCEIIGKDVGIDCCAKQDIKCTNHSTFVEDVAKNYGFKTQYVAVNFQVVVNKIKEGKAVSIYHYFNQGTQNVNAHAVVAYGTYNISGKDYLVIYDPIGGVKKFWDDTYVVGNMAWFKVVEIVK